MQRLDHLVVLIDDDPQALGGIRGELDAAGLSLRRPRGTDIHSIRSHAVLAGDAYLELVQLADPSGKGWYSAWVKRFQSGARGLFSIVLETQQIVRLAQEFSLRGIAFHGPESPTYSLLGGLVKVKAPWQMLFVPALEGTSLDFAWVEFAGGETAGKDLSGYSRKDEAELQLRQVVLRLPRWEPNQAALRSLFPGLSQAGSPDGLILKLETGQIRFEPAAGDTLEAHLEAASPLREMHGRQVRIADLDIELVSPL